MVIYPLLQSEPTLSARSQVSKVRRLRIGSSDVSQGHHTFLLSHDLRPALPAQQLPRPKDHFSRPPSGPIKQTSSETDAPTALTR
jgi:hypothetical protein